MKLSIAVLLAALTLALTSGCARRYTITTNGGGQIISRGKPKLQNGAYVFKNLQGERATVPAGRVREIAPSSMASQPADKYPGLQ